MRTCFASPVALAQAVRTGDRDPVDITEATLERIRQRNGRTNAYVTVLGQRAREQARQVRERVRAGEDLSLAGVPVAVKDLSETIAGVPNTKGLVPLAENVAAETSVTVRRLEAAGAVIVGTTNTPELGHTVRTNNELIGPTATPWDPDRNAGGSSGGSGAALADGLCGLATGSDVGGSLRHPAACCGVVSVKPTHGLVPSGNRVNGYRGHTPVGVMGPMARDIESLAALLDVLAGQDPIDPFSHPHRTDYRGAVTSASNPSEFTIAQSSDLGLFAVESGVRSAVTETTAALADAGVTVDRMTPETPGLSALATAYSIVVSRFFATAVTEIERGLGVDLLRDHRLAIPDQLVNLAGMGHSTELDTYADADFVRTDLYHAIEAVLAEYDALVCPTVATPPLTHDEPLPTTIDGQSVSGLPTDWSLAWPFNMTGHPVVNVPAGTVEGLPVGLQIVGRPHDESTLLKIAAQVEAERPWSYPDT